MSPAARATLGAVFGGLFVLLAHPSSRPYLLNGLGLFQPSAFLRESRALPENARMLSAPRSLAEAALWLQTGAEIEVGHGGVTTDDALSLAEIAQIGAAEEPDNAYWHQMESLWIDVGLRGQREGREAALRAWRRAALAPFWNDRQGDRLAGLAAGLSSEAGTGFAWHWALAYSRKTSAAAQRLGTHAVAMMDEEGTDRLPARYATLQNGALIRDGGRSAKTSAEGIEIVEWAALGRVTPGEAGTPRANAVARGQFVEELRRGISPDAALNASREFVTNDAWLALVPFGEAEARARRAGLAALVSAGLPGSFLLLGAVGVCLWGLGVGLQRLEAIPPFRRPLAPWIGIALGAALYASSGLVVPACLMAVTLAAFTYTSDWVRRGPAPSLTRGFRLSGVVLSLTAVLAAATFLLGSSRAAFALGGWLSPVFPLAPGSTVGLQIALVASLVVALHAPGFAYVTRSSPDRVLPAVVRLYGATLAVAGLSAAVVSAPVCMAVDRSLGDHLARLVLNEGNTYLLRETPHSRSSPVSGW